MEMIVPRNTITLDTTSGEKVEVSCEREYELLTHDINSFVIFAEGRFLKLTPEEFERYFMIKGASNRIVSNEALLYAVKEKEEMLQAVTKMISNVKIDTINVGTFKYEQETTDQDGNIIREEKEMEVPLLVKFPLPLILKKDE